MTSREEAEKRLREALDQEAKDVAQAAAKAAEAVRKAQEQGR